MRFENRERISSRGEGRSEGRRIFTRKEESCPSSNGGGESPRKVKACAKLTYNYVPGTV